MAYLALYRKYRPLRFDQVIGQEFVTSALTNAVRANRLAHAYLFSGPRGTGKTSAARIFARAINCLDPQDGEPCNACANCRSILAGQWGLVEIDGASHNRVEDMRSLLDSVHHVPMSGRFNVYIIDEVHMLSTAAFNAFLKTLEEPPEHVKFILATTEPFKIPRTVHSRCQHYLFQTVPTARIAAHLERVCTEEGIALDPLSGRLIAEAGNGSIRDALSVLDRVMAYCGAQITPGAVQALLGLGDLARVQSLIAAAREPDEAAFLTLLESVVVEGHDLSELAKQLLVYGRVLLLLEAGVEDPAVLGVPLDPAQLSQAKADAAALGKGVLYRMLEGLSAMARELRFDLDKRLGFELGILALRRTLQGEAPATAISETRLASPRQAAQPVSAPTPPLVTPAAPAAESPGNSEDLAELTREIKSAAKPKPARAPAATKTSTARTSKAKEAAPTPTDDWGTASTPPSTAPRDVPPPVELPEAWRALLESARAEHPAWSPLLEALRFTPGDATHAFRFDPEAMHPIAREWWNDAKQRERVLAAYEALHGTRPAFQRLGEQPTLAGLAPPEPAGWAREATQALASFFPQSTTLEER